MTMSLQQEDVINKPESKVRFLKIFLQRSHEEISIGGCHPGSHSCALNYKVMEGFIG